MRNFASYYVGGEMQKVAVSVLRGFVLLSCKFRNLLLLFEECAVLFKALVFELSNLEQRLRNPILLACFVDHVHGVGQSVRLTGSLHRRKPRVKLHT